jgi:hypothetical protein
MALTFPVAFWQIINQSETLTKTMLDTIISKDACWVLSTRGNQACPYETLMWSSWGGPDGESGGTDANTGSIKIGYFTAKNTLHLALIGGGASSAAQKTIKFYKKSDDSLLLSLTASVLGVDANSMRYRTIDTSSINGQECYIEFTDNAEGGYGWFGFSPTMFVQ